MNNVLRIFRRISAILLIIHIPAANAQEAAGIQSSDICENSAAHASRATGVPLEVLLAISLTETGRKQAGELRPWPWTVNMEGKGVWFDTRHEALAYVAKHHKRGARSFDVGCFQLNFKWHGMHFSNVEEMFDPVENALYAANFLKSLHQEKGNWPDAAAAYHSRTPKYANKYKSRFQRILAGLGPVQGPAPAAPRPDRSDHTNAFPLLTGSSVGQVSNGSLFPNRPAGNRIRLIGG